MGQTRREITPPSFKEFTAPLPTAPPLPISRKWGQIKSGIKLPASPAARKKSAERKAAAWAMYCAGKICLEIGEELGITESAAARLIKKAAREHPAAQMTREERSAIAMQLLFDAHRDVKAELAAARAAGQGSEVRSLLAIQSLSASRCARVLEAVPEVVPEVVQQQGPVFNIAAFAALMGGAQQQQLPEQQPITVEVAPQPTDNGAA